MLSCRCCGSNSVKAKLVGYEMDNLEQAAHQYFKCLSCGAIFLDHIPAPKNYDESGYYQRKNVLFSFLIQKLMLFFYHRRYEFVKSSKRINSSGVLLDIGCGKGNFLDVARRYGWRVCGIEPTKRSADYARDILGLNVTEKKLQESNIEKSTCDVVTMWHVLEHLSEPCSALREVYRVLTDSGILIVAVPNIESVQALWGGGRWFHLDPPRHVVHFSRKFLSNILENNGFTIEKIYYFSAEYNVLGMFQTLQNKILPWPNFTFNLLKRNTEALPKFWGFIIGCISSLLLLLILPIIIVVSLFEAFIKRGGTVTIVARKIPLLNMIML